MLVVLLAANAVLLAWLIRSVIGGSGIKPESQSRPSSDHKHKHKHRAGKKCPDCGNMIDVRRTICQHCGHKFEVKPGTEPHPDEVKAGTRKPTAEPAEDE